MQSNYFGGVVLEIENRRQYDLVDIIKYLGSVFVVFIHTLTSGFGIQLGAVIGRFAVPFFLIISACFFVDHLVKQESQGVIRKEIIIRYVIRIAKLYFFWLVVNIPFVVFYAVQFFRHSQNNVVLTFVKYIFLCVYNSIPGYGISWYLVTSIFSACVIGFLYNKINNSLMLLLMTPFFLISVFTSTYGHFIRNFDNIEKFRNIYTPATSIFAGLFFFAVGVYVHDELLPILEKIPMRTLTLLLIITLIGVLTEANFAIQRGYTYSINTTDQFFMIVPFAMCIALSCFKFKVNIQHARFWRQASTVTYLSQFIFIFGIKFLSQHFSMEINTYLLAFFTIVGTLILTFFLVIASTKYKWMKLAF